MEMRGARRKRSLILNVTSLIDVLFLLLIFFMISTTFLSQPAIKLELPEAEHSEAVRQTPLVVHVDQDGRIYLNDEPIELSLGRGAAPETGDGHGKVGSAQGGLARHARQGDCGTGCTQRRWCSEVGRIDPSRRLAPGNSNSLKS
jgi:hypothetical protein